MLRLVVNSKDVELYEDAPVNLRFQYSDVEQIQNPLGSYSQTFRVPLTDVNRGIFGNLDEPSLVPTLNLHERLVADLYNDGNPIVTGFLQVKAIYQTKEHYGELELVFFSGALDLKAELEGLFLSDLNMTSENVDVEFDPILLSGGTTNVKFGYVDRGQNFQSPGVPFATEDNPIRISELTPFIKAKRVLEQIITEAGFTFESTYLNSTDFGNIYLPLLPGTRTMLGERDTAEFCRVAAPSNQTITPSGIGTITTTINLSENATGGADPGGNWSNSQDRYTVPDNGLYRVRLELVYDTAGSTSSSGFASIELQVFGTSLGQSFPFDFSTTNQVCEMDVFLLAGQTIRARIFVGVSGMQINVKGTNDFADAACTTLSVEQIALAGGYDMVVSRNFPKMLQFDFLSGLQRMFNLVFIQDRLRPNHLIIDTYENYAYSGTFEDWTQKVDYSKDVKIMSTADLQGAAYEFKYKQGNDFVNKAIQDQLDRTYGRYRLVPPDNDFSTGETIVESTFAPYVVSYIPGTSYAIHRSIDGSGNVITDPVPMLAYIDPLGGSPYGITHVLDENNTLRAVTSATRFFSMYSTKNASVDSTTLMYGQEQPLYQIIVPPWNTLYFRFWAQYIKEVYSSDARVLECTIRFDEADMARFDFGNTIFLKDATYRLLSIDFDAANPSTAKIKLIKRLADLTICADTPTGINSSDFITFNNSASDFGSQVCCELYGYEWFTRRSDGVQRCRPPLFTTLDV